jgi:predicted enzyme related to lactoylglutathione lyase
MKSRHPAGSFCWFELGTTDQNGAKAFYGALFDWTADDTPMDEGTVYTIFKLAGEDVGAAFTLPEVVLGGGARPHWLPYVAVDNVDASLEQAASLGATVLQAGLDVGDFGRMGTLQDPTGAVLAVWEARSHAGVGAATGPGTAGWVELSSPDQAAAGAFYSALFGWEMTTGKDHKPAAAGDYFHILHNGKLIGGVVPSEHRDPTSPARWVVYFSAASCEKATAQAVSLGARPLVDTISIGADGVISVIADPQDAVFAIHQS